MSKVLIIDDEKMITQTLETLIEMMLDYEVFSFNDPVELLESKFLDENEIDLVVSDFMMPGKNGIEVLTAIKEKQPKAIPILLTGYADKESAIKSINDIGLYIKNLDYSPVKGPNGNIEYLLYITKKEYFDGNFTSEFVSLIVNNAHEKL